MIKPYIGEGWYLNNQGERITCVFNERDKVLQAICDICADAVCDEDGDGSSVFVGEDEANEVAQEYDWVVIGKHHLCTSCQTKIERGEIDISINVLKGANNEGK